MPQRTDQTRRSTSPRSHSFLRGREVEIEIGSWPELVAQFAAARTGGWVFRGQANYSWPLFPSLARRFQTAMVPSSRWEDAENSSIGFFKHRASAQLDRPPADDDLLAWLALMQHYRAPTRLLDWSGSPFVAAYFAFASARKDQDAVLWALHAYHCRVYATSVRFEPGPFDHLGLRASASGGPVLAADVGRPRRARENDQIRSTIRERSFWPLPALPFDIDHRMAAQQAVFTVHGDLGRPLDELMDKRHWPSVQVVRDRDGGGTHRGYEPSQLIKRIQLPHEWQPEALESLAGMGVTAEALFPGLDGIGDATALHVGSGRFTLRDYVTAQT